MMPNDAFTPSLSGGIANITQHELAQLSIRPASDLSNVIGSAVIFINNDNSSGSPLLS